MLGSSGSQVRENSDSVCGGTLNAWLKSMLLILLATEEDWKLLRKEGVWEKWIREINLLVECSMVFEQRLEAIGGYLVWVDEGIQEDGYFGNVNEGLSRKKTVGNQTMGKGIWAFKSEPV